MTMIQHIKDKNIYTIDYSGKITFEKGLLKMIIVAEYFHNISLSQEHIKVIYDVRKVCWESIETHNKLSKMFRNIFSQHLFYKKLFLAVLNNQYDFLTSEDEHWFTKEEDAICWLEKKSLLNYHTAKS